MQTDNINVLDKSYNIMLQYNPTEWSYMIIKNSTQNFEIFHKNIV